MFVSSKGMVSSSPLSLVWPLSVWGLVLVTMTFSFTEAFRPQLAPPQLPHGIIPPPSKRITIMITTPPYQRRRQSQHHDHISNIVSLGVTTAPSSFIASSSSNEDQQSAKQKQQPQQLSSTPDYRILMNNSTMVSLLDSSTTTTTTTNGVVSVTTTATNDVTTTTVPWYMVLWKFTRPHTIIGSALAVASLHALALGTVLLSTTAVVPSNVAAIWTAFYQSIIYCTIPACLMNLYITGLNQITDVEIDKINKPYLPIPAKLLSKRNAIIVVMVSLLVSLGMGSTKIMSIFGPTPYITQGLQVALVGSGLLGTLYSLSPFRLKRFPLLAAFCIIAVRGAIINASFYSHAKTVLVNAAALGTTAAASSTNTGILSCLLHDPICQYNSMFYGIFGMIIALFKDIPDVKGDALMNIRTMSVRLGPRTIYRAMITLIQASCWMCGMNFMYLAYQSYQNNMIYLMLSRFITSVGSFVALRSVHTESKKVIDPSSSEQVYTFYMHLWKLFYVSYFLLPFAR